MLYLYTTKQTVVEGPVPLTELKQMYLAGNLPSETKVCAEGTKDWMDIQAVLLVSSPQPTAPLTSPDPSVELTAKSATPAAKNTNNLVLVLISALILAIVTTGLIIWPINSYVTQEELAGRMQPPKWLVKPVAFGIVGLCFLLTRIYMALLYSLFFKNK